LGWAWDFIVIEKYAPISVSILTVSDTDYQRNCDIPLNYQTTCDKISTEAFGYEIATPKNRAFQQLDFPILLLLTVEKQTSDFGIRIFRHSCLFAQFRYD